MVVGEQVGVTPHSTAHPWGGASFGSQANSRADANPSSLLVDGAAVPVHCLPMRVRIANTVLAKRGQKLRK
jgi:hypothetical protein